MKPTGVFVRIGSASVPATEYHIGQMIKVSDGEKYIDGLSLNQDLTFNYAARCFKDKNVAFGKNEMVTLGLIRADDRYSNLALLLSDQCAHIIKAAVFQGKTKEVFLDREEFSGSLFEQLDGVLKYISLYNKKRRRSKR